MVEAARRLAVYSVAYFVLQLITGIEVALVSVALVLWKGWPLLGTLAFTTPFGLPLLVIQASLLVVFYERLQARHRRSRKQDRVDHANRYQSYTSRRTLQATPDLGDL